MLHKVSEQAIALIPCGLNSHLLSSRSLFVKYWWNYVPCVTNGNSTRRVYLKINKASTFAQHLHRLKTPSDFCVFRNYSRRWIKSDALWSFSQGVLSMKIPLVSQSHPFFLCFFSNLLRTIVSEKANFCKVWTVLKMNKQFYEISVDWNTAIKQRNLVP